LNNPNSYTEQSYDALTRLPNHAKSFGLQYMETPLLLHLLFAEGRAGLCYRICKTAAESTAAPEGGVSDKIKLTLEKHLHYPKEVDLSLSWGRVC